MAYMFYLDKMLLPIAPSKLQLKIENQNKTLTLINDGEINILKKAGLTDVEFDTLIPNVRYPFARYKSGFQKAKVFLDKLEELKVSQEPFQFIVTREITSGNSLFGTNMKVSLESYTIKEEAKQGLDVVVSIKLKQYRDFATKTCKVTFAQSKPQAAVQQTRETTKSPAPVPDKNDTTNNTTTNNDNSTVREDRSSTRNDYSGSNNTSTVHNYYTTEEAKVSSDESVVAVMAQPSPSPIYESVKSNTAPAETKPVEQETKNDTDEAATSTPKNIRIEANGADVVFELNEDGYNISINANSNNQEVMADTPVTSSINWYEVAKIGLLAAIAFTLLWKPKRTVKNDLI